MSKAEEEVKPCEGCGASIYPEHIKKHTADYFSGKLLCAHCLQEKKLIAAVNPAAAYADQSPPKPEDPIALVLDEPPAEESSPDPASGAIRAFGGGAIGAVLKEARYRRPLLGPEVAHATRCRTFHCKLNDASFAHLNDQINEWVDAHDEIEIRFATSCIGVVEGKHVDPHLIVTVFY